RQVQRDKCRETDAEAKPARRSAPDQIATRFKRGAEPRGDTAVDLQPSRDLGSAEIWMQGAERAGRAFRHGQGPHFTLRSARSIDDLLKARACVHKERATAAPLRLHG